MLDWRWLGLYEYQNPRLLSVINYSEDIANLGGNRNKGLNERISNRQKDHYINEQENKNVYKVTAPIDFK